MLHIESPHQGFYAPLSQLMTDSDSEEEIHNLSKHRKQQQQQQQQQLGNCVNTKPSIALNNQDQQQQPPLQYQRQLQLERQRHRQRQLAQQQQKQYQRQQQYHQKLVSQSEIENNRYKPTSYTTNMQNTFRTVMMADGGGQSCDGSNFSSFNSDYDERHHIDADNVAILGGSSSGRDTGKDATNEPMSPARRFCFILSLLLCVVAVCGFVWVVPCGTDNKTCPAPVDRIKTHNWFNNYTKLELKGGINVVNGLRSWENNLIFLYRGDLFFPEFEPSKTKRNGIICLIGNSGVVAWFDEMVNEPVAIDCSILDVDRNGKSDCLVVDEYGEVGAINPLSGQWYWKFRERSTQKLDSINFPIMLPDLDGDGVLEILIGTRDYSEQKDPPRMHHLEVNNSDYGRYASSNGRNYLRILSGRSGKPIGEGYKLHNCDNLRKIQLENSDVMYFKCVYNNTDFQSSKTLGELYALITNKSIGSQKLLPVSKIAQHHYHTQSKDNNAQRNIYSLSGRELIVENKGKCPDDCNVTFILRDIGTSDGKVNIIKNFTNADTYGMIPAQWHFKNSKSKMSGFVMKFWKWEKPKKHIKKMENDVNNFSDRNTLSNDRENKGKFFSNFENDFPIGDYDAFEHLVQKRHTFNIESKTEGNRIGRNETAKKLSKNNHSYKMRMITETVILVIFIGSDTRIENTSQSNIIQFCHTRLHEDICQPDLSNQENSMLIADLDQDGSQELVSYVSMFNNENVHSIKNWKLVTYVRLLRLQEELPQFYNEVKHN